MQGFGSNSPMNFYILLLVSSCFT